MRAVFFCLILSLCCLIGYFRHAVDLAFNERVDMNSAARLPDARVVKLLALGFDDVLFDYYWLEFIQYIGDVQKRQLDHSEKAAEYLNLLTKLDPHFIPAYYFAAIVLGEQNQSSTAANLIDQGIAANPDNWYLPYIAGINQYLFAHDERRAAQYYLMASKFPAAPDWLERQAKILEANIPSTIKEINVWDSMYTSAPNQAVKERAFEKLVALWLKVYRTAPSKVIKERALNQLKALGVSPG